MLSHDVNDVLDMEWKVKDAKRLKRKRKHQTSSGKVEYSKYFKISLGTAIKQ